MTGARRLLRRLARNFRDRVESPSGRRLPGRANNAGVETDRSAKQCVAAEKARTERLFRGSELLLSGDRLVGVEDAR